MNICEHCGEDNRAGVLICEHCGQALHQVRQVKTTVLAGPDPIPAEKPSRIGTATLGTAQVLSLHVIGADRNIILHSVPEVTFGRFEGAAADRSRVDLTDFGGLNLGVSRVHATLKRDNHNVILIDRGSSNGTFVNGHRLQKGEAFDLRDGDEIQFGALVTRIQFG